MPEDLEQLDVLGNAAILPHRRVAVRRRRILRIPVRRRIAIRRRWRIRRLILRFSRGICGEAVDERDDDRLDVDLRMQLSCGRQERPERPEVKVVREDLIRQIVDGEWRT